MEFPKFQQAIYPRKLFEYVDESNVRTSLFVGTVEMYNRLPKHSNAFIFEKALLLAPLRSYGGLSLSDVRSLFMDQDTPFNYLPGKRIWKYAKMASLDPEALKDLLATKNGSKIGDEVLDNAISFIWQYIQDVAFGSRTIKCQSIDGDRHKQLVPKFILTVPRTVLIDRYTKECKLNDTKPLGATTMHGIVKMIAPSRMSNFAGLDNSMVDGKAGIDFIISMLDSFRTPIPRKEDHIKSLYLASVILKTHLQETLCFSHTNCAAHCVSFAFGACSMSHTEICDICNSFNHSLQVCSRLQLNDLVDQKSFDDAIENAKYMTGHIVRGHIQRFAQRDVLGTLADDCVYLICDWAMKYLALRHREKMADWYAKAGIHWHVTVAYIKISGKLVMMSFNHLADNSKQDAGTVARIAHNVLKTLKQEHPHLKSVIIQSDNAGCYHSFDLILSLAIFCLNIDMRLVRLVFCEAQDGKNICDRTLAVLKGHLSRLVSGKKGDILKADDIRKHLVNLRQERFDQPGLQTMKHVSTFNGEDVGKCGLKIDSAIKITRYSDFSLQYDKTGCVSHIHMQEQSNFGKKMVARVHFVSEIPKKKQASKANPTSSGRKSYWVELKLPQTPIYVLNNWKFDVITKPLSVVNLSEYEVGIVSPQTVVKRKCIQNNNPKHDAFFKCNVEGCIRKYSRQRDALNCQHSFRVECLSYRIGLKLKAKMESSEVVSSKHTTKNHISVTFNDCHHFESGFAIKPQPSNRRFSKAVKSFLTNLFNEGVLNNSAKLSHINAKSRLDEAIRISNESKDGVFDEYDVKTADQIKSYFSRLKQATSESFDSSLLVDSSQDLGKEDDERTEIMESNTEFSLNEEPDDDDSEVDKSFVCGICECSFLYDEWRLCDFCQTMFHQNCLPSNVPTESFVCTDCEEIQL